MPEEQVPYEVEQDDKVCPLRMINASSVRVSTCRCLKDKCAWWDGLFNKCAIPSLINQLVDIEQRI